MGLHRNDPKDRSDGRVRRGCNSAPERDPSQPGLFDTLEKPAVEKTSQGAARPASELNADSLTSPDSRDDPNRHVAGPKIRSSAELHEIADPGRLAAVLRGREFLSVLTLACGPAYQTAVLAPLAEVRQHAAVRPHIAGFGFSGTTQSHENELAMHRSLQILAERLGPVALLDRLMLERAESGRNPDNKYLARMFREAGDRNLGPFMRSVFVPAQSDITINHLERAKIPNLMAQGLLAVPEHPKETALRGLIENAEFLRAGGRVLVIGEDGATNKYLAEKCRTWAGVKSATRAVTSPEHRASLTRPEGGYQREDRSIEILVLKPDQLKGLKSSGVNALHCALVVVHSVGVNQKTSELKIPEWSTLPMLFTKQVVQLATTEQVKTLTRKGYDPLNLKRVVDDKGTEEQETRDWTE